MKVKKLMMRGWRALSRGVTGAGVQETGKKGEQV